MSSLLSGSDSSPPPARGPRTSRGVQAGSPLRSAPLPRASGPVDRIAASQGTVPDPPPPPPPPPPAQPVFDWESSTIAMPAIKWLNSLKMAVARHVRLPRTADEGPGNQHPSFTIVNTPFDLCRRRCEEAGLTRESGPTKKGKKTTTVWKGNGPMVAYRFCDLKTEVKKFGIGSALLIVRKKREFADQLVIAIPPITVKHQETRMGDYMSVDFFL